MDKETLVYWLIRFATAPLAWMPYSWIRCLGRGLGALAFHCMRAYRKRSLSNLALAKDLRLSPVEIVRLAKRSFQNLAINCLEYPRFGREKEFSRVIQCENPEAAEEIYRQGKGIVFFCGHQSNWEALFLDGTARMRGVAIGKAIKNKKLYRWIVSIREKQGGTIISPRNAIREGLRTLRKGAFLGIVGDQGMPGSGYSFPFLGRRAWTSTTPALLAYKTESPLIFAATRRTKRGYRIRYSEPIWPNGKEPIEAEIPRMMDAVLSLLQESIKSAPGEWLWQHNRWKQQTPQVVYKRFRHDSVCLILPPTEKEWRNVLPHLSTFKAIYPTPFLFLFVPEGLRGEPLIEADEIFYYTSIEEVLQRDFRFKLVFNFTSDSKVRTHYEKLSAFEVLDLEELKALAAPHLPLALEGNLSEILKRALSRPGILWQPEVLHAS